MIQLVFAIDLGENIPAKAVLTRIFVGEGTGVFVSLPVSSLADYSLHKYCNHVFMTGALVNDWRNNGPLTDRARHQQWGKSLFASSNCEHGFTLQRLYNVHAKTRSYGASTDSVGMDRDYKGIGEYQMLAGAAATLFPIVGAAVSHIDSLDHITDASLRFYHAAQLPAALRTGGTRHNVSLPSSVGPTLPPDMIAEAYMRVGAWLASCRRQKHGGPQKRAAAVASAATGSASVPPDNRLPKHALTLLQRFEGMSSLSLQSKFQRGIFYQARTLKPQRASATLARLPASAQHCASAASDAGATSGHQRESWLHDQLARRGSGTRVCLVGPAGMGKSTLLEEATCHLAQSYRKASDCKDCVVPFFLALDPFSATQGLTLEQLVCQQYADFDVKSIRSLCEEGRAVFLLDPFVPLPDASQRRAAHRWLEEQASNPIMATCSIVVAGRPEAFQWDLLRTFRTQGYEVQGLSRGDIETYIRAYFRACPARAEALVRGLDASPSLKSLLQVPLHLMLACFVAEDAPFVVLSSIVLLIESAIHKLLKDQDLDEEAFLLLTGRIAWSRYPVADRKFLIADAAKTITDALKQDGLIRATWKGKSPEAVLKALVDGSGVLLVRGGFVEFAHEAYAEYLAGRWLASQNDKEVIDFFEKHAWDPSWSLTVHSCLRRLWQSNPALAIRLIQWLLAEAKAGRDDVYHSLTFLATRLAALAAESHDCATGQLLDAVAGQALVAWRRVVKGKAGVNELVVVPNASLASLIPVAGERVTTALMATATEPGYGPHAVEVLASGDSAASAHALRTLASGCQDPATRSAAARALADTCAGGGADFFGSLLGIPDPDGALRDAAFAGLARAGGPSALDVIWHTLKDGSLEDKRRAAKSLAEMTEAIAEEDVTGLFAVPDEDTRHYLLQALERIGAKTLVSHVTTHIDTCTSPFRAGEAVGMLARRGTEAAFQAIAGALKHPHPMVRFVALLRLEDAKRTSPGLNAELTRIASDSKEVDGNRTQAAWLLARDYPADAALTLIPLLKEDREHFREHLAKILGRLRSPDSVDQLLDIAGDCCRESSAEASCALVSILGPDGAISALVAAMRAGQNPAARCAAVALAHLASGSTPERLMGTYGVGKYAIRRMRSLIEEAAVPILGTVLTGRDSELQTRAAHALGVVDTEASARLLVQALAGRIGPAVKLAIVFALGNVSGEATTDIFLRRLRTAAACEKKATTARGRARLPLVVEALAGALARGDKTAQAAADALGKMDSCEAVAGLVGAWMQNEGLSHARKKALLHHVTLGLAQMPPPSHPAPVGMRTVSVDSLFDAWVLRPEWMLHERLLASVLRVLEQAAQAEYLETRSAAMRALVRINTPDSIELIVRTIVDWSAPGRGPWATTMVRQDSVWAIAQKRPPNMGRLLSALDDPDPLVRGTVARALGEGGIAEAVGRLVQVAGDTSQLVGFEQLPALLGAFDGLAALGTPEALDVLIAAASAPNGGASAEARNALVSVEPDRLIPLLANVPAPHRDLADDIVLAVSMRRHLVILQSGEWGEPSSIRLRRDLLPGC
jgi:HEAT repeat protein